MNILAHVGRSADTAVTAELGELIRRIEAIEHPCHVCCIGVLHADCQCASWVRQEAEAVVRGMADFEKITRQLVIAFDPFDYEAGLCYWCNGGWEQVPGPRGGKGKYEHTGKHKDDCPFAAAQAALDVEKPNGR